MARKKPAKRKKDPDYLAPCIHCGGTGKMVQVVDWSCTRCGKIIRPGSAWVEDEQPGRIRHVIGSPACSRGRP